MRVIYCAGDQGRVVLDILRTMEETQEVVFADDDQAAHGDTVNGIPVIGGLDAVLDEGHQDTSCIVAFGNRLGVRLDLARRIAEAGLDFFNAVHSDVALAETAKLGNGVQINAQAYIGPGATVADHVLVDSCVNISHDVHLGPGATITPGATLAGGATVGEDAYIGPGATVLKGVSVGAGAVVGGGAVVVDAVSQGTTVVGVPARPTNEKDSRQ